VQRLDKVRIVVTRARHQAEQVAASFRELGADVILLPLIDIAPAADLEALRHAVRHCNAYDWIIFTSVNAVNALVAESPFASRDCKPRVATIGAATREAAETSGFRVSITPDKYVAESLVEAFAGEDLNGKQILIPSAAVTRDVVAPELRKQGAQVDVVEAYRNVIPPDAARNARRVFQEPFPDWVTFASPSAVASLVSLVGTEAVSHSKIATIGPVTSEAARKHNLTVAAEASVHSAAGLVEAVASCKTGL
jgi:uroporphyrinogen-III synthase